MVKVKEVFVAGGIPKITYVARDDRKLEKSLGAVLDEGYQIICITGPTKSGKSVLCRRVLTDRKSVWIEGGQVSSLEEFWRLAVEKLDLPTETVKTEGNSRSGGVSYVIKIDSQDSRVVQEKRVTSAKSAVLTACKANKICVVVDDFHFMSPEIQKGIVRSFKAEIFDGLDVVFIAVPHRAFDAIAVEPEMQGRFVHIEIPPWTEGELIRISEQGFPVLKMTVPDNHQEEFARESFGSPILMQRFCLRLCAEYDVKETLLATKQINSSDRVRKKIYSDVAENFGFPTYKVLIEGPQSRTDRIDRALRRSNGSVDIYETVLMAIAQTGPKPIIAYNDIRDALRIVLADGDLPQKQQTTNTITYMVRESTKKLSGEPPLEWKDDVLYITDPSLLFYLRWKFQNI